MRMRCLQKVKSYKNKKVRPLKALRNYYELVDQVENNCRRIQERYAEHIVCEKGCGGNCCRIHLSVFPVEAISLATALKELPGEVRSHIRQKARITNSFGPCPLLEKGACLMYASRLIICRTHGLPMRLEYRGHHSIGFCQKNFRKLNPISDDAIIDLNRLNRNLAAVNQLFLADFYGPIGFRPRFSIGEALLIDL
jgi:Fe-S-cluster containining protein